MCGIRRLRTAIPSSLDASAFVTKFLPVLGNMDRTREILQRSNDISGFIAAARRKLRSARPPGPVAREQTRAADLDVGA